MKKKTLVFILIAAAVFISSCSPGPAQPTQTRPTQPPEGDISVCLLYNGGLTTITDKFFELHPDFRYTISTSYISGYTNLDSVLKGSDAPDIYFIWSPDVTKYTQGEMSGYFMPYEELGIDLGAKIAAADIFPYIVDIGTRTCDNAVVGLSWHSTGGAFLYNRSIAKDVWGTDDPAVIKTKIGPGWDKFLEAAEDLKKKGYAILFDGSDIWDAIETSADKGWISDGKLYIDPKREAFLDLFKKLADNGYTNIEYRQEYIFGGFGDARNVSRVMDPGINAWADEFKESESWNDTAVCEPPVSFFNGGIWVTANKELANDPKKKAAVAEFIEWLTLDCTEEGFQYYLANGSLKDLDGYKGTVASGMVMEMSDGTLDNLGGQDMFDVFLPASQNISGRNVTEYDAAIETIWLNQADSYVHGKCTRGEAIAAFKQEVKEQLGINAW